MTTADTVLLVGLIGMGGLFMYMAVTTRFILASVGSTCIFLAAIATLISGGIGPGFTEEWVVFLSLGILVLAFTPLLLQMQVEVHHEKRFGQSNFRWKQFEKRGWNPEKYDKTEEFRRGIRMSYGMAAKSGRSRRVRKPSQEDAFR